jgi:nitrate/TMAO reductase-like tetraheme cytochrome c subunit
MRRVGITATLLVLWALALTVSARAPQRAPVPGGHAPASAAVAPAPTADDCLTCHEDDSLKRAAGTPVTVHKNVFAASVHGSMACVDCHADLAHAELPHPDKLAKVDCATCHADEVAQYKQSAHAGARATGSDVAATCVSCHGVHDIRGKKDPESRTYHLNIAATCARCHGNPAIIAKGHIAIGDVASPFKDSIHGRALSRSGLLVAPTCSDCHGPHDIRKKSDPASRVALANVPATCGKCHEGIGRQFAGSVHAGFLANGRTGVPACQTCHTPHAIQQADNPQWQLTVVSQCGSCHTDKLKTYRDTFHGQVTKLGFRAVATCADCHGNHRILPARDPASPVARANLVQTCGKCHTNANANFVKYDPHADKHNRERNTALYVAARSLQILLVGVFGFFGLHSALWFARTVMDRRPAPATVHARAGGEPRGAEPRPFDELRVAPSPVEGRARSEGGEDTGTRPSDDTPEKPDV